MFDLMKAFDTNRGLDFPYFRHSPWTWYTSTETKPEAFKVTETEENVEIFGEVPGFSPEEVEVSLQGRTLSLSGNIEKGGFKRSFTQRYTLGKTLDLESIAASVKDGLLNVSIKKLEPKEPEKRVIPVSTE